MIRDPRLHCGRDADRTVNPAEVVIGEGQRESGLFLTLAGVRWMPALFSVHPRIELSRIASIYGVTRAGAG